MVDGYCVNEIGVSVGVYAMCVRWGVGCGVWVGLVRGEDAERLLTYLQSWR
jgi:hypothetical protein